MTEDNPVEQLQHAMHLQVLLQEPLWSYDQYIRTSAPPYCSSGQRKSIWSSTADRLEKIGIVEWQHLKHIG